MKRLRQIQHDDALLAFAFVWGLELESKAFKKYTTELLR